MKIEKRVLFPLVLMIAFIAGIFALNFSSFFFSPATSKLEFYANNKIVVSADVYRSLIPSQSANLKFDICDLQKKDYSDFRNSLSDKKASEDMIALLESPKIGKLCPGSELLSPSFGTTSAGSSETGALSTSNDGAGAGYSCGTSADPQCAGTCPPGEICSSGSVEIEICTCPLERWEALRLARQRWRLNMQEVTVDEMACPSVCDPFGDVCIEVTPCWNCRFAYPKIYIWCQEGVATRPGCACVPNIHT